MEIEQIYKNVDTIILTNLMIQDTSMQICQSLGYNGFKRLHRWEAKEMMCKHQELECSYYDKYQKVLRAEVTNPAYSPSSLKEHFTEWKSLLEKNIQQLGELNQEHFDVLGITNCTIEYLICDFTKHYEKVCRWIKRFDESSWDSLDCHIVDDYIHKKYKEIEG